MLEFDDEMDEEEQEQFGAEEDLEGGMDEDQLVQNAMAILDNDGDEDGGKELIGGFLFWKGRLNFILL